MDFIQVDRVIKDKSGIQVVAPEVIAISEIKTFRPWKFTETDTVKGKCTLLVLKSTSRATGQPAEKDEKENLPTMVINESFTNFLQRMSGRVILMGNAQ
jgi:hypothetical protein